MEEVALFLSQETSCANWEGLTVTIYQDRGEVCAAQQLDLPCQRNPDKGPGGYPLLDEIVVELEELLEDIEEQFED